VLGSGGDRGISDRSVDGVYLGCGHGGCIHIRRASSDCGDMTDRGRLELVLKRLLLDISLSHGSCDIRCPDRLLDISLSHGCSCDKSCPDGLLDISLSHGCSCDKSCPDGLLDICCHKVNILR